MNLNGKIVIEGAIAHIIDRKKDSLILSDYTVELSPGLEKLVISHIEDSIRNNRRMFAKFKNTDALENDVENSCNNIFAREENFVVESKNICRRLNQAMQGTRATSANILIIKYKHGDIKAIAIIKLNFNTNYFTNEELQEDGTKKVVIKNNEGFNDKQRLEKAAFIYNVNNNYELVILDKQDSSEGVSEYFAKGFLNCTISNDSKINTKNMIKEMMTYINDEYKENPIVQRDCTYAVAQFFENNTVFTIDKALGDIFDTESADKFKDIVKDKKLDYEFRIDRDRIVKRFHNRALVTDNGLEIRGDANKFNSDGIEYKAIEGEKNLYDIIIKRVRVDKNKL